MTTACRICDAERVRSKLRKGGVEILQCEACGVAFWEPPSDFEARSVYARDYFEGAAQDGRGYDDYGAQEPALRRNFAERLARLGPPGPGERLLDVGAAFGFAAAEAAAAGWRAAGLEISPEAARRAAANLASGMVVGDARELPFADASFRVVTLWDALEHLPDPHASIAEAARVLRPGGRLLATTGDVGSPMARLSGRRWHLYTLPEHLFFYSRRGLRTLLERHGFEVRSIRAEGSVFTLGYLVERLRKTLLGDTTPREPRWPGARLRVRVNLFDVVLVEATLRSG